ncbi:hypothetical protein KIPB_016216 [Kipferlia bialata]|uniref:Uncharacterized protein n=1 Tax=Kipferlia bialata TaxID=797122 RepID=A0A9K3GRG6_9EUKA|nr:hypothetical protein KIPB_016216 [Kipferlia bialata]|eukprot:g16216.t1
MSPLSPQDASRMIVISSVVCCLCQLDRAVVWAYRPLTQWIYGQGRMFNQLMYVPCFYLIPNDIPSITISLLMLGRGKPQRKSQKTRLQSDQAFQADLIRHMESGGC